jgi:hypothetical protein
MRLVTVLAAVIFAFIATTTSMHAQGRGNGQAKKTTASAPKVKAQTPKQTAKADTRTAKATAKADTRAAKTTAKADTRAAKADAKTARKSGTTTTDVALDVTPTTPTTVKNAKLEARLATLLPGVNIQEASQGFKNWGQFMAAAHVSNNLNIPFADLKALMTGIAPGATVATTAPMSLGQAIQSYKGTTPETATTTKISTEVKKAEDAANVDLRRSRDRS